MPATLREVEAMVDALDPTDQIRLLTYLAPRIAMGVLGPKQETMDAATAWREFRAVGERLASLSGKGESITQAVSNMRR